MKTPGQIYVEINSVASDKELRVGQTLNVPNRVTGAANNASTFKPYDPAKVVGDTTPTLNSPPPPPQKKGCGGLGQLLMVVVAVVVAINAPQLLTETFRTAYPILTAAGSAALGSVASQAVGVATGTIDKFSWKGVALSALSGGITKGLPEFDGIKDALKGLSDTGRAVANAAVANAMTQGIAVITGLQDKFDWRGVAASAVGTRVGLAVGGDMGMNKPDFESLSFSEQLGPRLASSLASGTAAAVARGGRVTVQQIAVDAFGNALGYSLAGSSATATTGDFARMDGQGYRGEAYDGGSAGPGWTPEMQPRTSSPYIQTGDYLGQGVTLSPAQIEAFGPRFNVFGNELARPDWTLLSAGVPRLNAHQLNDDSDIATSLPVEDRRLNIFSRSLPPLPPIPRVSGPEPSAAQYVVRSVIEKMDGIGDRLDAFGADPSTPDGLRIAAAVVRGPSRWIPDAVKSLAAVGGYAWDEQFRGQVNAEIGGFLANDPIRTTRDAATRYWNDHSLLEISSASFNLLASGAISAPLGKLVGVGTVGAVSAVDELAP